MLNDNLEIWLSVLKTVGFISVAKPILNKQ